jgi:NAD(P)H-nitrite reductase large subunit
MSSTKHVVIIGNGVAGVTAARHIRKLSDHAITIISAESDHFYSRTALMYIYMGHMTYENTKPYEDWFWEKNRIDLVRGYVKRIDTGAKQLHLVGGTAIDYDVLIVATGSKSNRFGWPGEDLQGVQGLYNLQDLEQMEENTKGIERAVVVGGGLIGIETAEMLCSRHIPVTFLVREQTYFNNVLPPEEGVILGRHIREHNVDLRLETELREIVSDGNGRVAGVITSRGDHIPCGFVALTVGVTPNIEVVQSSEIAVGRGVLVDEYFRTNVPDVYAIGDCAEFIEPKRDHPRVEQLWYTGKMHGEVVAHTICGVGTPYRRGVWFNSAKFFDIEYQTYGFIWPSLREGEETLYWEHPDGRKCIRINYSAADGRVLGFNLLGVRYRHAVCERWIREGADIRHVLENLGAANFDPEFFDQFERDVVDAYNRRGGEVPVTLKRRRGFFSTMFQTRGAK